MRSVEGGRGREKEGPPRWGFLFFISSGMLLSPSLYPSSSLRELTREAITRSTSQLRAPSSPYLSIPGRRFQDTMSLRLRSNTGLGVQQACQTQLPQTHVGDYPDFRMGPDDWSGFGRALIQLRSDPRPVGRGLSTCSWSALRCFSVENRVLVHEPQVKVLRKIHRTRLQPVDLYGCQRLE